MIVQAVVVIAKIVDTIIKAIMEAVTVMASLLRRPLAQDVCMPFGEVYLLSMRTDNDFIKVTGHGYRPQVSDLKAYLGSP